MTTIIVAVLLMTNSAVVEIVAPSLSWCLSKQINVERGVDVIFDGPEGRETIARVLECKLERVVPEEDLGT